ncbi:MAG: calcium-binding protein [Smithella sp.]
MASALEYMQFALCVYNSSKNNEIGVPEGWTLIDWQPDRWTGFSAGVFKNNTSNEIVISFTGTNDTADTINWSGGAGFPALQIFEAMGYYMAFKNAYPTANIAFTGHSLGGGLASLMAVFFDKQATVFDQMPSQLAALNPAVLTAAAIGMLASGYSDDKFSLYWISKGFLALTREANVINYYIEGEILQPLRTSEKSLVGKDIPIRLGNSTASIMDRHSMALLTATKISTNFLDAVQQLPNLVTQLLDEGNLFAADSRNKDKDDLLRKLLKHQLGVSSEIPKDGMLERFAVDMLKIAQEGGLTMSDSNLTKALTTFAMQMYSNDPKNNANDVKNYLFDNTGVTGGIHFDRSDVAANLSDAIGYKLYFQNYLRTLPGNENGVVNRQISELLDWYIQAGTSAMMATAGTKRAFMLGGSGGDNLSGGTAADLLYGGAGSDMLTGGNGTDTLIGGAGNDVLNGGLGHDIYEYTIGDGNDQIIDEDRDGDLVVFSNGDEIKIIALGNFYKSGSSEWKSLNNSNTKIVENMLYLPDGSTIEFGTALQSGDYGINLIEVPTNPESINTMVGDLTPVDYDPVMEGIQARNDPWGNVITDSNQPEPGRIDLLYDTTANDRIEAGEGNDGIVSYRGGNDWLLGGSGNDSVIVERNENAANDILEGNEGSDIVEAGKGNDKVFGENYGEMEELIAAGETAISINVRGDVVSGGGGEDYVYGSNSNDVLFGGFGKDLIIGGGGEDVIIGDDNYLGAVHDWSYSITTETSGNTNIYGLTFTGIIGGLDDTGTIGNDDVIYGGTGNDYIDGVGGDDEIYGGDNDDILFGSAGNDVIEGGAGDDAIKGDGCNVPVELQGDDYIDGGTGNDLIWGNSGNDELFGGNGLDTIYGDESDDYIDGEAGADSLYGGSGNDEIFGGNDDDYIEGDQYGFAGNDYLDGEEGNDTIIGGGGADELFGGEGNDTLHGDASNVPLADQGDDYIDGEGGDNFIVGYGGNDTIYAAEGNDTIYGDAGDDYIEAGDGTNTIYGGEGNDAIYAGTGADQIDAGLGDDYIDAGDGSNIIVGGEGNNEIHAGADDDQISSSTGNDYIDAGDGNNVITSGAGDDVISSGAGNDQIWGGTGRDEIYSGAGDDQLYDEGGDSIIYGGEGNDWLQTTDGNAYLDGGAGDDTLLGGTGNDTIYGGTESDYLQGNSGNDTYIFSRGDGSDIIQNYADDYWTSIDTLQFGADINDVTVTKENNDLRIGINETTDSILIWDWFSGSPYQIDQIQFSDGTMLNSLHLEGKIANTVYGTEINETILGGNFSDTIYGGAGNDEIWGYNGDDTLDGSVGDDTLVGSFVQWGYWCNWCDLTGNANGNDTYIFGSGYGQDMVLDRDVSFGNTDTILLDNSIQPEDLILRRGMGTYLWNTADDLVLSVNGSTDTMTVVNWFDDTGEWQVERIKFSNGTVWDEQIIRQMVLQPTAGDDYLIGYDSDDLINGLGGNDYIEGRAGNDVITGGRGDDILYGGAGNDTYYFNLGDGTDTIYDNDVEVYIGNNTIIFGDGITPGMIRLKRGSLLIEVGDNGDSIRIPDFNPEDARANPVINTFAFADGTTLTYDELIDRGFDLEGTANDDAMTGTKVVDRMNSLEGNDTISSGAGNDILTGGTGNDELYGGSGSDTYVFNLGDGVDTITDTSNLNEDNMIHFGEGITKDDLTFARNNGTLTIDVGTNGDAINLLNFDQNEVTGSLVVRTLEFADGSQIKISDLLNRPPVASNPIASQTAMEDAVFSFTIPENSFVDPDTGDALAYSATLIDSTGLPSWLVFDAATMTFSGTPTNDDIGVLSLQVTATDTFGACVSSGFNISVQPIVNYGTNHTDFIITGDKKDFIKALGGSDIVYTGEGDDTIYGGDGTDLLCGDGGNDAIYGENDSDVLLGGKGNDILDGGAGRDIMMGGDGNDTYIVDNTRDIVSEFYNEGTDTIKSSITYTLSNNVENLTLAGTMSINGTGNNLNNIITGNNANNTLTGNAGNDILDGGSGDDILAGGKGSDSYLWGRTGGHDTITETAGVSGDADMLRLTGDITKTEPVLVKQNNDLYVFIDSENYMKIVNEFQQTNYGIERLEVTDGHYITRSDIQNIVDTMSAINNDSGMDVMQKYNAMTADQQYQNILAQSWQQ